MSQQLSHDEGDGGIEKALSEIFQMLEEGHLVRRLSALP
jgi:hypothetical protein